MLKPPTSFVFTRILSGDVKEILHITYSKIKDLNYLRCKFLTEKVKNQYYVKINWYGKNKTAITTLYRVPIFFNMGQILILIF
jgi:hypothetical protein